MKRSRIVAIELKIHQNYLFAYVKRDPDMWRWRVYQHLTRASLQRIFHVAEQITKTK